MAYTRRDIRGGAIPTTLSSGINSGDMFFTIAATSGWPDGSPGDFFVVIDRETASEEKIRCVSRTGTTVTVQTDGRGEDGTTAAAHSSGAAVEHCITAVDLDEANYTAVETVGKITATGDLLIGDGTNSLDRLALGTTGLPLVAGASTPAYGQLGTSGIADDAITGAKIATDAVGAAEIVADAVGTSELAADAVTTSELADDAVATANIATGAVTADEIGALAVTSTKLHSGVVDDSTLQHNSGVLRIKDGGVTQAKFASSLLPTVAHTDLPTGVAGQLWFDTDNLLLYVYNGTDWVCITPVSAVVATSQTTTSTSYTNLATTGPAVTVLTGTKVLVTLGGQLSNSGIALSYMGFTVSGASTVAAADTAALLVSSSTPGGEIYAVSRQVYVTGLTAGSNVFTAVYKVQATTGTFVNRNITVVGIP